MYSLLKKTENDLNELTLKSKIIESFKNSRISVSVVDISGTFYHE